MSTKVFVSQYIEGPKPPQSPQIIFALGDWREIMRHVGALMSPGVQWRTCKRWLAMEAAAIASIITTATVFLASSTSLATSLLVVVDIALVFVLVAALLRRACKNYYHHNAPASRSISPLAFRLSNGELCRALKQAGNVELKDHVDDCHFHRLEAVTPAKLEPGDIILVEAGQFIYVNGVILCGAAVIDESAVTGGSMYVLREADGDCEVMHDTLVVAGRILVEVTPRLGHPLDWITGTTADTRINEPAMKLPVNRL